MKKSIVSMLLTVAIISAVGNTAIAKNTVNVNELQPLENSTKEISPMDVEIPDPLHDFIPPSINYLCEPMITRSVTRNVSITEPCDQYWRNTYPDNWMWQANRAVANADAMLGTKYGIQYYSVAQKYWNSDNTTGSALLAEVISEWGLTDGAKMMVAFSGRGDTGLHGIARVGNPYALIFDGNYEYNRETVQHETGHCYGLDHCQTSCVMTEYGMGNIDTICSRHNTAWNNAKTKY